MSKPKQKNKRTRKVESSGESSSKPIKKPISKPVAPPSTILGIPKNRIPLLLIFLVITFGGSFAWYKIANGLSVKQYTYELIDEFDHDTGAFTQGLLYDGKHLYESTGLKGESDLRKVDLKTGEVLQELPLADEYFGEGLTLMNDKFYQVTWKEETGFIYDRDFKKIGEFKYKGQGWGLTNDGTHLILSDGTPTLRFIDPKTFEVVRRQTVRYGSSRQYHINELEYMGNGRILANIHDRNFIVEIDANNGKIVSRIDCRGLVPKDIRVGVLNGIARKGDHLLVTGKNWPKVYEIKVVEKKK